MSACMCLDISVSMSACMCLGISVSMSACMCLGISVSMSACMCLGISVSMAGFLAAETLCDADLSESVVDRAVRGAELKQQQALKANQPSHGKCCTGSLVNEVFFAARQ